MKTNKFENGSLLCTKDGRKIGNAIIVDGVYTEKFHFFLIKTDFGNILRLTENELNELFYTPSIKVNFFSWMKNKKKLMNKI